MWPFKKEEFKTFLDAVDEGPKTTISHQPNRQEEPSDSDAGELVETINHKLLDDILNIYNQYMNTGPQYAEEIPDSVEELRQDNGFSDLHISRLPSEILLAIEKYNREYPGPEGNTIHIGKTCVDALKVALDERGVR